MIISVNWLKKYTDIDLPVDELVSLIGSRLVEIEGMVDLGKKYEGIVVAKVVECAPLEDSDHLNLTKIDDGGAIKDVERDENGLVQVICGAPNVAQGQTVAWLPPGTTVPASLSDKEPFVLGAKELRGHLSNGMIASAKELDLWDDHTGILVLEDDRKPGEDFAKAYELDDYLFDIENKSLTHRPDAFGFVGFAREVAGIQGKAFSTPARLTQDGIKWIDKKGNEPTPHVSIDNPKFCSRYQAVVLANVDSKAQLSPLEIRTYLSRVGVKSHSAVVDVTNYMMMISGQPLHAFDYDKLKAVNDGKIDIHVRGGRAGEHLTLLDGREIELDENDIVIANGETAVALAGAMGGRDTEIDDDTENVLLESASFNLYNLRGTQMRHGIFSEAITRFTKGQPAELTNPVLAGAVDLLSLSAGAERVSDVADVYPVKQERAGVYAMAEHMNAALGSQYTTEDIVRTLENVEFDVSVNDKGVIKAVPPYWRADIHISEDLDEEVGRLNGFDNIPPTLPKRDFTAVSPSLFDQTRSKIRTVLARAGANEVLTYSFVHGNLLKSAGQKEEDSYKIVNSLSPDLQYYRQSLTPSLLQHVHPNIKAGYDMFALFELNKAHAKALPPGDDDLPQEMDQLSLVYSSKNPLDGAVFYHAKHMLDYLALSFGLELDYLPLNEQPNTPNSVPFEYRRSAKVVVKKTGDTLGIIGEFRPAVTKAFKLPASTAGFSIGSAEFARVASQVRTDYVPLSRFPSTGRDVTLACVDTKTSYRQVKSLIDEGMQRVENVSIEASAGSIYVPEDGSVKNFSFSFRFTAYDRTLESSEVNDMVAMIVEPVTAKLGAKVV